MHPHDQDRVDGLLKLAEALGSDERLASLAEYCRCRERGLRREAFAALERFLAIARRRSSADRRRICITVLDLHARTPSAHRFLTQPLCTRFVFPVLETWTAEEPDNPTPLRWLGLLRYDENLLQHALLLCPGDAPVRRQLASLQLATAEHATHHLGESRLLGDLDATRGALARARAILDDAPDPAPLADIVTEIAQLEALLDDWESYCRMPEGTFPEWCARRKRGYAWPTTRYYTK